MTLLRIFRWLLLCACLFLLFPAFGLDHVSPSVRYAYLIRGQVWHPTNIPDMDILAGPGSDISVAPEAVVPCRYDEKDVIVPGATPKFQCKLTDSGIVVRVKYSRRETFAEVAGTRLLWALGFYADEVFPVKLHCFGCPEKNPGAPSKEEARVERLLLDTIMERDFPGKEIVQYHDQGWAWNELDEVDERVGGASRAQIDALKLLAVFVQHSDSKRNQQRLACYSQDMDREGKLERCRKPVLMIQDLGETFGRSDRKVTETSAMSLKGWMSRNVWNQEKEAAFLKQNHGKRACFGNLIKADYGTLENPRISEEGRLFLARLLNQLSDQQIYNLFRVARAGQIGEVISSGGWETRVTIDDWVSAFKAKRQQINDHRCS